ncbi:hypothetical protein FIBSPDRAFT_184301 [Athelia psychrophila]|uniref:Uncharacterized protein n=1 Tax=Athelia psychrophila TaxID=1759441 RepID=A0A166AFM6_9AGAM|nr:hypothetical protein FIBSPDRAFT_184301 [Fibularhizoctonia sp. CBS 109695]
MDSTVKTLANRFNGARARIWNALGGATHIAVVVDELEEEERRMSAETLVDAPGLGRTYHEDIPPSTAAVKTPGQISTGRGGSGNFMVPQSRLSINDSPDRFANRKVPPKVLSTGRGGAGNIRSTIPPSGTAFDSVYPMVGTCEADKGGEYDREVLAKHRDRQMRSTNRSCGRGGAGNISHAAAQHT